MATAGNAASAQEANTSGSTLAFCCLGRPHAVPDVPETGPPGRPPRWPATPASPTPGCRGPPARPRSAPTPARGPPATSRAPPRARRRTPAGPPAVTARTTSLAVPPNTAATRLTSVSDRSAKATRRWGEMARLIEVWGAWNGAGGSPPRTSRLRAADGPGRLDRPGDGAGQAVDLAREGRPSDRSQLVELARERRRATIPLPGAGPRSRRRRRPRRSRRPVAGTVAGGHGPPERPGRHRTAGRGVGSGERSKNDGQDLGARHPVDDGVVDLGHDADPAVRPGPRPRGTPTAAGVRSSGREARSATERRPARRPARRRQARPGARGSRGRSPGSSTRVGCWRPKGTSTIRIRKGGTRGTRSATSERMRRKPRPPGTAVGSKTMAPRMWRWVVGDSRARKAPSSPVSAGHAVTGPSTRSRRGPARSPPSEPTSTNAGRLDPLDHQLGDAVARAGPGRGPRGRC